jgi:hypothetical protein
MVYSSSKARTVNKIYQNSDLMKPDKLRRHLFETFSKNWQIVRPAYDFKEQSEIIDWDFRKAVICPLCMRFFNTAALSQESVLPLTLEHCPPEELGGKPKVLLCKECNSKTGHDVDVKLMEFLHVQPFNNEEINSSIENKNTVIKSKDAEVRGTTVFKRLEKNKFYFDLKAKDEYRKALYDKIQKADEFQITYKPHETPSAHLVHVALLKIAYLLAFHKFGHLFILNSNYDFVRKQILNPEQKILKSKGVSQNTSLPLGFYLISQPLFAKGILVVFELTYAGTKEKYAVILNHPNLKDIAFYGDLSNYNGRTFSLEKEDFRDIDFLTSKENIGLYYRDVNKDYSFNIQRLGLDFIYKNLD